MSFTVGIVTLPTVSLGFRILSVLNCTSVRMYFSVFARLVTFGLDLLIRVHCLGVLSPLLTHRFQRNAVSGFRYLRSVPS